MLGMAYVPNAVIAAAGYVSGVGFEMGAGTYSPFGTTTVDLPAVPLLAAAPDQAGRSWVGLVFLVVPAVAGYLIARPAIKNLATRSDRVLAAAVGAALTGGLLAAAAAIARGGVGDGRWSTFGAPPALLGAVVAVEVGAIAMAVAGLAGGRSVPWRLGSPVRADEAVESRQRSGSRSGRVRKDRPRTRGRLMWEPPNRGSSRLAMSQLTRSRPRRSRPSDRDRRENRDRRESRGRRRHRGRRRGNGRCRVS